MSLSHAELFSSTSTEEFAALEKEIHQQFAKANRQFIGAATY